MRALAWLSVAWLLVITACSGGDGEGGAGGTGTIASGKAGLIELADSIRAAQCAWLERCSRDVPVSAAARDECAVIAKLPATVRALWVLDEDEVGFLGYDPARAAKCIGTLGSAGCTDGSTVREACIDLFVGTLGEGECCEDDGACLPTLYCKAASDVDDRGTCAARAAIGGPCDFLQPCVRGAYCAEGTCKQIAAVGGACTRADATSDVEACGDLAECVNGVCVRPSFGNTGDACDEDAARRCLGELDCISGSCVRRAGVQEGGSCVADSCAPGFVCDDADITSDGLCHAAASLGDACGPGYNTELFVCDPVSRTWRLGQLGDACETDSQCIVVNAYCSNGTCAPLEQNGRPCERDNTCSGFSCLDGTCGDLFQRSASAFCADDSGGAGVGQVVAGSGG